MVAEHTVHLLATARSKADGQVVKGVKQKTGHRRRIAAAGNLMIDQELTDGTKVLADFCRHDVERAAQGEYRVHIFDVRVEREGTVSTDAVGGSKLLHVNNHGNKVAQSSLMEHGSLRFACRARSINHVGQAIGIRQVDRLCIGHIRHEIVDEESLGGSGAEVAFGLFGLQNIMRGNQHLRFRVFKHIAQSLVGVFEIQRRIGSSSLMDGEHRQREFLLTVEHDTDKVVGLHAKVNELMRQSIRVAVHLAIGQLAVLVDHCGGIGCAFGLFGEEVGEGLSDIHVNLLTCT